MSRASSPTRSEGEQESVENDEIEIEQLIALMHRRPPLWDKFDPKYHDRVLKARLWEEIYKQIHFMWDQYSVAERKLKGADVQKKWKNLKDTYFKEVAADKKVVSGQARKKKKRPYIHMGALSFLSTQKSMRDTTNNIRDTESPNVPNPEDFTNQCDEDSESEVSQNKRLKARMRKKIKNKNNSDDELLKQLLQEKKYDEDVSFCEMLIPMLNKLSTDQKHYAKIEILNALHRAAKYSPQDFMPPTVSSALRQYQSPSSYSSYSPNTPSPYPNTPSPYTNTVRQSPPPDPSPQTHYTPSRKSSVVSQSQPNPSPQTQYTLSRNPPIVPQFSPDPSPLTQYTPSRKSSVVSQSQPDPSPQTQYTLSRNPPIIPQFSPDPSTQTQYTPSRKSIVVSQSQPDPSPQTQYTLSRNPPIIPQLSPDPSPQTQYRKSCIVSQSQPDPSPQDQNTLSLSSNFPNTSFSHSSYVVEGSGFEMKDFIIFK